MAVQKTVWLGMSYNVPINPSKARVYVWRKLKEFGAEYLKQGIAILPNTPHSMQQFTLLAGKIRQMSGEASIIELRFCDPHDETQMATRFKKQIEQEYQELLSDCTTALRTLRRPERVISAKENERLKQMIKRYRKARARDYFMAGGTSGEIEQGLNEIIDSVRAVAADFGKQLRQLMEN